jgi:hypothetical protein
VDVPGPLRVFLVVDEELFPLREGAATSLGEELRRGAAGDLGDQGYEAAALTVADAIEDVLVGAADEPIELNPEEAEAVFYVLDARRESPRGDLFRLYRAVREAQRSEDDS